MATGAKLTELLQLLDLEQIEENIFVPSILRTGKAVCMAGKSWPKH